MKFILFFLVSINQAFSVNTPNEQKVYYHVHQATNWAEIYHVKKSPIARGEIERHLGTIKYAEQNLVHSKFYEEYLKLKQLSQNLEASEQYDVESLRENIHAKAEKNKIPHPQNWQEEFLIIQ